MKVCQNALCNGYSPETLVASQCKKCAVSTSGQDEGVAKHASPPCATAERITTNLKTNNTQNCQKVELYNEGFKEATFIQMGRVAGRGSMVRRGGGGRTGGPTFTCGG